MKICSAKASVHFDIAVTISSQPHPHGSQSAVGQAWNRLKEASPNTVLTPSSAQWSLERNP